MKHLLLLSICIIFYAGISKAQNSVTFSFGRAVPSENIYLTKGISIDAGHQFEFKNKMILQTTIGVQRLSQNDNYSFDNDPVIDKDILFLFYDTKPEILYSNFNLKSGIGRLFFKDFFIQPYIVAGVSVNYTLHSYMLPEKVDENSLILEKKENNHLYIGGFAKGGVYIQIKPKIGLGFSGSYNWFPANKIGSQEKSISTTNYQFDIIIKL